MLELKNPGAALCFPGDYSPAEAFEHTTHLGVGAHQDDIEIMACHGILKCLHRRELWFGGVTCTAGSGPAAFSPAEDIAAIRIREQNMAAAIGQYSFIAQLDYASADIKNPVSPDLKEDLKRIFKAAKPSIIYTHNPTDKHDTHVAVCVAVIEALRENPVGEIPPTVYGCEVWRSLDWLPDADKVILAMDEHENVAGALLGVHDSQITGGKNYHRAAIGRWHSNATFLDPHTPDLASKISLAMDLSPLVQNSGLDIIEYVESYVKKLEADITDRLRRQIGKTGT